MTLRGREAVQGPGSGLFRKEGESDSLGDREIPSKVGGASRLLRKCWVRGFMREG